MNRYPMWKYAMLAIALLAGLIYTLPNLSSERPAVQVSSGKVTTKVDEADVTGRAGDRAGRPEAGLRASARAPRCGRALPTSTARPRPRTAIVKALEPRRQRPNYIVACSCLSRSPHW
jgi:preprotein translocase subunit SecD